MIHKIESKKLPDGSLSVLVKAYIGSTQVCTSWCKSDAEVLGFYQNVVKNNVPSKLKKKILGFSRISSPELDRVIAIKLKVKGDENTAEGNVLLHRQHKKQSKKGKKVYIVKRKSNEVFCPTNL